MNISEYKLTIKGKYMVEEGHKYPSYFLSLYATSTGMRYDWYAAQSQVEINFSSAQYHHLCFH